MLSHRPFSKEPPSFRPTSRANASDRGCGPADSRKNVLFRKRVMSHHFFHRIVAQLLSPRRTVVITPQHNREGGHHDKHSYCARHRSDARGCGTCGGMERRPVLPPHCSDGLALAGDARTVARHTRHCDDRVERFQQIRMLRPTVGRSIRSFLPADAVRHSQLPVTGTSARAFWRAARVCSQLS